MDLIICALDFSQCSVKKWCLPETETWLWETSWTIVSAFVVTDFEERERERNREGRSSFYKMLFLQGHATHSFSLFRQMQHSLSLFGFLTRQSSPTTSDRWEGFKVNCVLEVWPKQVGVKRKGPFSLSALTTALHCQISKDLRSRENLQRIWEFSKLWLVTKYKLAGHQAFSFPVLMDIVGNKASLDSSLKNNLYQAGTVQPARDRSDVFPLHLVSPLLWLWKTILSAEQQSRRRWKKPCSPAFPCTSWWCIGRIMCSLPAYVLSGHSLFGTSQALSLWWRITALVI